MSTDTAVDLVVIGLGPGGEHLATEAAKAGLSVVGIDERLVGGECPYYGCIPSKMVIRAANLLADARRVGTLAGAAEVAPDWGVVHARIRDEATDDWDDTVAVERLEKAGVRFVRGHGRLVDTGVSRWAAPGTSPRAGVVLNTGTSPAAPPVDGLADTPFWTNRDVLATPDLPASMVVIGGGAIGAELAQAFARFGTTVSLLEAAPRILALEEPESSDVVARAMAADGIQVLAGAKIGSVHHADGRFTVSLTDAGGTALDLGSDRLLVAAGRRPNIADLGLETVGLDPKARAVDTDAADAGRRQALGDRRHHRQGRLHPHVDVPGERRARRHHRPRRRPRGRVPRRAAGDLHRPGGRVGRPHRAAGPRRRARRRASVWPRWPSRPAAGSPAPAARA